MAARQADISHSDPFRTAGQRRRSWHWYRDGRLAKGVVAGGVELGEFVVDVDGNGADQPDGSGLRQRQVRQRGVVDQPVCGLPSEVAQLDVKRLIALISARDLAGIHTWRSSKGHAYTRLPSEMKSRSPGSPGSAAASSYSSYALGIMTPQSRSLAAKFSAARMSAMVRPVKGYRPGRTFLRER
jgi:hypothetical protein